MLKVYLTRFYKNTENGTECWCGPNILSFTSEEVQKKIEIHNTFTNNKLILDGELICED